jgi:hypothetical protein
LISRKTAIIMRTVAPKKGGKQTKKNRRTCLNYGQKNKQRL